MRAFLSRTVEGVEEFSKVRVDPDRNRLWPVVCAAVVSVPLLFLSMRFSLMAADWMKPMVQLGMEFATLAFMFVLASAGWFSLAATIVALWVAIARKTFRWRFIWSVIAVLAAGILPLSWVFTGALFQ